MTKLSSDPCAWLSGALEDGRLQSEESWSGPRLARGDKVAKKSVGDPHQRQHRDLPGSRVVTGNAVDGGGVEAFHKGTYKFFEAINGH